MNIFLSRSSFTKKNLQLCYRHTTTRIVHELQANGLPTENKKKKSNSDKSHLSLRPHRKPFHLSALIHYSPWGTLWSRAAAFQPKLADNMLLETQCYVVWAEVSKEKPTSTISLTKPRKNAKAVFKTTGLFVYGYIYYITHTLCENVLKIAKP
jgi:hypothetical protein